MNLSFLILQLIFFICFYFFLINQLPVVLDNLIYKQLETYVNTRFVDNIQKEVLIAVRYLMNESFRYQTDRISNYLDVKFDHFSRSINSKIYTLFTYLKKSSNSPLIFNNSPILSLLIKDR
jgi:hypothetical protein